MSNESVIAATIGGLAAIVVSPDLSEVWVIALVGTLAALLGVGFALDRCGQADWRERTEEAAFDGAYVGLGVGLFLWAAANVTGL